MSLADKYKEELKGQGIKTDFKTFKPKKDRTRAIIVTVAIVLAAVSYSAVYQNYNACSMSANYLSTSNAGSTNSTPVNTSFSLTCATNLVMYSVTIALMIAIIVLLILKALRLRKPKV